jgi:hypothetical protein
MAEEMNNDETPQQFIARQQAKRARKRRRFRIMSVQEYEQSIPGISELYDDIEPVKTDLF